MARIVRLLFVQVCSDCLTQPKLDSRQIHSKRFRRHELANLTQLNMSFFILFDIVVSDLGQSTTKVA